MSLFDKYFFGYLPKKTKLFVRLICVFVLLFLILEIALTFILVIFVIALLSKFFMKLFN